MCSKVFGSVSCTFSSLESYTRGTIKCGFSIDNLSYYGGKDIEIKFIYYCTNKETHGDRLKRQHYFLILEDSQLNYHKLELSCLTDQKEIKINITKGVSSQFKYIYRKSVYTSGLTLKELGQWIKKEYEYKMYNQVTKDCNKLAYDIIYKFSSGYPEHTCQVTEKIKDIYFFTSDIEMSGNMIEHAYVIISTDSYYWKCEISGYNDKCVLNIENVDYDINWHFYAKKLKENKTLNDLIELSESQWGNSTYGTLSNNCFDYCKFIMRNFTDDQENENKVKTREKKNIAVGGATAGSVGATALLGMEVGAVAGPVGVAVGAFVGATYGFLGAKLGQYIAKKI